MLRTIIFLSTGILTFSCKQDEFCRCYKWRNQLIQSYQESQSEKEKSEIEKEMNEFDLSCIFFQTYTGEIETEEELNRYFKKVETCEAN